MKKGKTIEQQAAETILQRELTVTLGGKDYSVPQPTVATLIAVSEAIAELHLTGTREGDNVVTLTLRQAKDAKPIGRIVALMMRGARNYRGLMAKIEAWRLARLARKVLAISTPKELQTAVALIISTMQVGDFFGLTAFLSEINLTKATKAETTASGRQ